MPVEEVFSGDNLPMVWSGNLEIIPEVIGSIEGRSVLDLGCGCGRIGYLIFSNWWSTASGSRVPYAAIPKKEQIVRGFSIGADLVAHNLKVAKWHKIYDGYVQANACSLPFKNKSFDTIICAETIEHLSLQEASLLFSELDRVAKKRIIITTPRNPFEKTDSKAAYPEPYRSLKGETKKSFDAMVHKSAISVKEFKKHGYKISGVGFNIKLKFKPLHSLFLILKHVYNKFFSDVIIAIKTQEE